MRVLFFSLGPLARLAQNEESGCTCGEAPLFSAQARVGEPAVVGRIFNSHAGPVGSPWMWTLAFGYHEDRTPTHGYAETREAAMAAFAKSWRRQ